ncbi:MAG: hypothetical protein QN152_00170 [Armatimonadota bacterium]|nr:hypothetical protein [Armatimonadota bacterium]MDR7470105.1 hypothetical protein [Armatimonadota bacterium]MDR7537932.1 hypothetical protein [Armatimonadota bacterium]
MTGMLAFVLCPDGSCRYGDGFADLRTAPHACPRCGRALLAACPHCGMLLRNRWGVCTNCGHLLYAPAAAVQPTVTLDPGGTSPGSTAAVPATPAAAVRRA